MSLLTVVIITKRICEQLFVIVCVFAGMWDVMLKQRIL